MRSQIHKFVACLIRLIRQESGQDLVEYALVVALLAFGATAGTKSLASGIKTAYTTISSALEADVT
jgi:pilus assembly protein Flp/PilA